MLSSQINDGAPRVLIDTERGVRATTSAQCNLHFFTHSFEGVNTLLAFPFRRNDTLRAKFDVVLSENLDQVNAIVDK